MENVSHGFILRLYDECQFNSNFKLYLSFESYILETASPAASGARTLAVSIFGLRLNVRI